MAKSPNAFRTISEVASWLGTQSHVLRFWETKFKAIAPVQRAGGRRYYRKPDMTLIGGIKFLLHEKGMTIKAVQKLLKDEGIAHVQSYSPKINIIETSNISKKRLSETIHSNSDKLKGSLASFHVKKMEWTDTGTQSEPLEHKHQPFLFPELQQDPEQAEATIEQNTVKPSETPSTTQPPAPMIARAGSSRRDPGSGELVGKIGPVTQILKLSIMEQSRLVRENAYIITQLENLQKK